MNTYDYMESIKDDIRTYLKDEGIVLRGMDRDDIEDIYDRMWVCDSVTGNASGSYTFSTYTAEENLCHNWDLLREAIEEFGEMVDILSKGPEWCDVIIRCHLLREALDKVFDEENEDEENEGEN